MEKKTWEIKIPLITNPLILLDSLKVFGIAFLIIGLLFLVIFGAQGEVETLWPLLGMFAIIFAGLTILSFLIMVVVFGNKFHCRFTLTPDGVIFENVDKRSKFMNRAAVGVGFVGGSPGTMGAGLINQSLEQMSVLWKNVARADFNPKRKTISLANSWRKVMVIYCMAENWQEMSEEVKGFLDATARPEVQATKKKSPVLKVVLLTVAAIIAVLPLFGMPYPFEIDIFAPILILCFAAASLWLSRYLSVVTILGCGYLIYQIISIGLTRHEWIISSGLTNTQFEMLDSGEWIGILITFAGLAFLIVLSILQLIGKTSSVLEGDFAGEN